MKTIQSKICFISTSPRTLWLFYRGLITQLSEAFKSCAVVTPSMPELDELRKFCTCTSYVVPISRAMSPFKDIKSIFQIARYLRQGHFTIVHAHTPKGGLVGILAATFVGIPIRVYTMHGLPWETAKGLKYVLLWFADWCVCKCATKVLAVSPSLRRQVIGKNICSADKIVVLGKGSACGIDCDHFKRTSNYTEIKDAFRRNHGIDKTAVVVGFVGRIGPEKGIDVLITVFNRLSRENNIYLLIVGEIELLHGPLSSDTIEQLHKNARIIRFDHMQDVRPFFNAIDLLVLPTLREGLPIVLLEAAAMEVPVIATRVTGCVDAVVDGKTGILVEKNNMEQLYKAIQLLIRNEELRNQYGRQARSWVRTNYNDLFLIEAHLHMYKKLISRR